MVAYDDLAPLARFSSVTSKVLYYLPAPKLIKVSTRNKLQIIVFISSRSFSHL